MDNLRKSISQESLSELLGKSSEPKVSSNTSYGLDAMEKESIGVSSDQNYRGFISDMDMPIPMGIGMEMMESDDSQMESEAIPSDNESFSSCGIRKIVINPQSSGFLVKVGCQDIAIESPNTLIELLKNYLENPVSFEKKWYSNQLQNKIPNILG